MKNVHLYNKHIGYNKLTPLIRIITLQKKNGKMRKINTRTEPEKCETTRLYICLYKICSILNTLWSQTKINGMESNWMNYRKFVGIILRCIHVTRHCRGGIQIWNYLKIHNIRIFKVKLKLASINRITWFSFYKYTEIRFIFKIKCQEMFNFRVNKQIWINNYSEKKNSSQK